MGNQEEKKKNIGQIGVKIPFPNSLIVEINNPKEKEKTDAEPEQRRIRY